MSNKLYRAFTYPTRIVGRFLRIQFFRELYFGCKREFAQELRGGNPNKLEKMDGEGATRLAGLVRSLNVYSRNANLGEEELIWLKKVNDDCGFRPNLIQ